MSQCGRLQRRRADSTLEDSQRHERESLEPSLRSAAVVIERRFFIQRSGLIATVANKRSAFFPSCLSARLFANPERDLESLSPLEGKRESGR